MNKPDNALQNKYCTRTLYKLVCNLFFNEFLRCRRLVRISGSFVYTSPGFLLEFFGGEMLVLSCIVFGHFMVLMAFSVM